MNTHSTVVAELEAGRQNILTAAEGLTDTQAATKPAPERWSVLDCLEHLTVVEGRFLTLLTTATSVDKLSGPGMTAEERDALMTDRTTRREAPEAVVPNGRFPTLTEALQAFHKVRDSSVQAANDRHETLEQLGVEHHRFGPMNGAQLLLMLNGHANRHAAQMREVRETLGI